MTTISDNSLPFTQLVWDDTTDVGMAAVFREDTKTSYIVANFTPAGNYGDVRNYLKNVKEPVEGCKKYFMCLKNFVVFNLFCLSCEN